jgi:predicted signal transduction protein with EAL and GGDEF domain
MSEPAKVQVLESQHEDRWFHRRQFVEADLDARSGRTDTRTLRSAAIGLEAELSEALRLSTLRVAYLPQFYFGTGYSSLSYLSRLPVDRLKLDRSLIHRMTLDKKSAAIRRLIVSLGAELDMEVIAEGVETEEHLKILTDLGCLQVQGYLLGRPMPAKQVRGVLGKPWGNRPMRVSDPGANTHRVLHAH